ncbi:hypothetical protein PInf_015535 [Phytophthora infestans]|nr:hypothetical protein PInf_015535 [Phytophthora infestans]
MKHVLGIATKRGARQKLLWSMVAAMAVLSLVLLTYAHLIYLPAMTERRGYRQFFRARRDRVDMSLRELYKKRSQSFNEDQQKVVNMTRHAWRGYRKFAGWSDYLSMPKLEGGTVYGHDMALTAVDSLDTLFIMGLHEEFDEATLDGLFRRDLPVKIPFLVKLSISSYGEPQLSEAGSFQLEFAYLARATDDESFLLPVNHVNSIMANLVETRYSNGLIPVDMDWKSLKPQPGSVVSVGALGDSHYEYLLKQWLLSGKHDNKLRDMYVTAVAAIEVELVGYSYPSNFAFIGKLLATGELEPAMEHLTCFVPGMLALGYYHGMPTSHLELAKELTETCVQMYLQSASQLAPDITQFITQVDPNDIEEELFALPQQDYNLLRPETVESLMILYRVTGDEIYREYGRIIMNAFEKQSKVEAGGYRSTLNVWYGQPKTKSGPMESFFIAETLKYLFLLFSDEDILSLDEIVFNTEAHPFPMWR